MYKYTSGFKCGVMAVLIGLIAVRYVGAKVTLFYSFRLTIHPVLNGTVPFFCYVPYIPLF